MLRSWLGKRLRRYTAELTRRSVAESPTRVILGIEVVDWEPDNDEGHEVAFGVVAEALLVIAQVYPTGLSGVRYLDRIVISRLPGRTGEYSAQLGAAVLDREVVLSEAGWWKCALTIIHEGTHARLRHCGIRYDQERRARLESICRRREIALARRMDGGGDWVEWLGRGANGSTLTDVDLADLRAQKYLALMESAGVPQVIIGILQRYHRIRLAAWRRRSLQDN